MSRYESICSASDLTQMRQRRELGMPELIGGLTIIGGRASYIGEIGCGTAEFVPHIERGSAGNAHGASLVHESAVEAFSPPIVGRGIGCRKKMENAAVSAEVAHLYRG